MQEEPTDRTAARTAIERTWLSNGGRRFAYGLGTALLRHPGDEVVLEHAYEQGFRYFDTSLYYGDSELVLGRFLQMVPRESVFVATKTQVAGRRFSEVSSADTARFVSDCLHQSLQRLGVEQVDLYQLHDVATAEGLDAAQEAARRLQQQGYFRYLGATGRDLAVLQNAAGSGWFDTVLTYSDYTPLRRSAGPLLRRGAQRGVAMINATPLAGRLLAGEDPRSLRWPGGPHPDLAAAIRFYDLCQQIGVSPRAVALQFPLRNSDIAITLTGPVSMDQVDSTLGSLHEPLPPEVWKTGIAGAATPEVREESA